MLFYFYFFSVPFSFRRHNHGLDQPSLESTRISNLLFKIDHISDHDFLPNSSINVNYISILLRSGELEL